MSQEINPRRDGLEGDAPTPLALFGAGHVGRALVIALASLPFKISWIDEREGIFPDPCPRNVTAIHSDDPIKLIASLPRHSYCLIMTHSHALDLALVDAALRREDFFYIGLIGSATKRARFQSRLQQGGLGAPARQRLVCPVGLPSLYGKDPAVIAASIAADLLIRRQASQHECDAEPFVTPEKKFIRL